MIVLKANVAILMIMTMMIFMLLITVAMLGVMIKSRRRGRVYKGEHG